MKNSKYLAMVATVALSISGMAFAGNPPNSKPADPTVNSSAKCDCGSNVQDSKTSAAESPKLKKRDKGSTTAQSGEVSQACRDAVERENREAYETLVRWR